jgi:hypothetical protein
VKQGDRIAQLILERCEQPPVVEVEVRCQTRLCCTRFNDDDDVLSESRGHVARRGRVWLDWRTRGSVRPGSIASTTGRVLSVQVCKREIEPILRLTLSNCNLPYANVTVLAYQSHDSMAEFPQLACKLASTHAGNSTVNSAR